MNSKRRGNKKANLPEVKIVVIGAPGVGKSALVVRCLTRRYITEYHHNLNYKYRHETYLDGDPLLVEIMDTCPKTLDGVLDPSLLQWGDCLCMVYSITDRESFNFVRRFRDGITTDMPLTLVGNKADLVHLRQVSQEEGEILAKDFECNFTEVAVSEQVDEVVEIFKDLCRDVLAVRRSAKHSLLDRMLGSRSTRAYSRGKSDSALPKE